MSFSFFDIFLEVCAPIFFVVGLGWLLDRKFRLHLETLIKLNIYLLVPAFIFARVVDTELSGGEALRIVAFTVGTIATMFICATANCHETCERLGLVGWKASAPPSAMLTWYQVGPPYP